MPSLRPRGDATASGRRYGDADYALTRVRLGRVSAIFGEITRLMVALLGGLVVFGGLLSDSAGDPSFGLLAMDLILGVAACGALLWRRRWPLPVALATTAISAVSLFGSLAALMSLVSLATWRRRRDLYAILPAWTAASTIYQATGPFAADWPSNWQTTLVGSLVIFAIAWLVGALIGTRRELHESTHERIDTLEREQALRIAQAKSAERARIAQEMHDVLAHRISLIAVHANALAYRPDLPREQLVGHAQVVRDNADRAVAELAGVLGVLRGGHNGAQTAPPQPTLADLADLVQESQRAGTRVAVLGALPDFDELATSTSRTGYRIVQECLTNARKHANGLAATVTIKGGPGEGLRIEVSSPLSFEQTRFYPVADHSTSSSSTRGPSDSREPIIAGAGMGLLGLAERVELAQGHFTYGPREGMFVVQAQLPWPQATTVIEETP